MTTTARGFRNTTGIGSLPHHNIDAALEIAFETGIPFLPQIPIRNPWEYMIPQALEGLPGLQVDREGAPTLDLDIWSSRAHELGRRLEAAFARAPSQPDAFEAFEPSPAISSSWQPFVWELTERKIPQAKIQIAGPLTSQWVLRSSESSPAGSAPLADDVTAQIYKLVMARALGMARRLQANGIQPLLYLDEPGLYALTLSNPRHRVAFQELKLMIQTLRKEGVQVGLHCCSNTDWNAILELGLQVISLDAKLSLEALLATARGNPAQPLEAFVKNGGRLSLGVIPTARSSVLRSINLGELFAELLDTFGRNFGDQPDFAGKLLSEAIFTPACGLALHPVSDADLVFDTLNEFYDLCHTSLKRGGPLA